MIKKLEIVNVGRFKSAKTDGDSQYFKQNTYIYGKNTFGKSTLAAIFRSVKENCPDIVIGRKTIGAQNQLIKIIPESQTPVGEYRYTTSENVWSNNYKDLIIFDNHFVRENVYTQNQQIGKEQQKSIESFMLGSTGIEYNQQISHLVEKIQGNTKIETAISGEYNGNKHLLGGLPFADFLALTEIVDIDEKIEQTQVELNQIKNAELISNKLQNIKIILERYRDFEISKIEENLQINIDVISEHYRSHINQSEPKSLYEQFLQIGSKLIISPADKRCPFCTQEIVEGSAQEFVKAINAIYNEKYRNLQANLKQAATLFSPSNFLAEVEKNTRDLTQAGHIFTADLSALNSHLIQCDKFINDKIFDLSLELEDSCFASVVLESKVLISCIEKDLAKFANPAEKKMSLEDSVKNLLANKERYSQWQEKCDKYLAAKNENTTLSSQKASLWGEYLEYTGGLSTSMLLDINTILTACGCNFIVQQFNFQGNQRQDLFVLSMDSYPICNEGGDCDMTIKNCLSDSDKWILALALFLTTVKNDSSIKVVLMDDPVSSFDSDRKRIILKEIERVLNGTGKQLILLTHEKGFYQLLHAEYRNSTSSVFLKIVYDSTLGSNFAACNPMDDAEFMNDYNCWVFTMKNALTSQDLLIVREADANVRKVIEHILKVKYPIELATCQGTVGEMLTKLEEAGGPYSITSPRLDIEALLPNFSHHDNSSARSYPVSELGIEDYKSNIRGVFIAMKSL